MINFKQQNFKLNINIVYSIMILISFISITSKYFTYWGLASQILAVLVGTLIGYVILISMEYIKFKISKIPQYSKNIDIVTVNGIEYAYRYDVSADGGYWGFVLGQTNHIFSQGESLSELQLNMVDAIEAVDYHENNSVADSITKHPNVTRVEVISNTGRELVLNHLCKDYTSISVQDEGRTLKIFVKK